jgi:hypothetical protein
MDFALDVESIKATTRRHQMSNKSKMGRKAVLDKLSENLVSQQIMPNAIKLANANFNSTDAKILLTKFQAKALVYFKTLQQKEKNQVYFELTSTETGLVFILNKEIVFSVYLEKPTIIHRDTQSDLLTTINRGRDKTRKETFFYYHRRMEDTMWGTNEELIVELKSWRKQKRENTLTIDEENNNEFVIDGRTYYTLVLTELDADGEAKDIGLDRLAIGVSYFVDGLVYWFVAKANRDATYKYVMEIK